MARVASMPQVVIVSPALRDDNNGNWQTARRWQRHLSAEFATRIVRRWPDAAASRDDIMIALHARRSAEAVAAWSRVHPGRGLALVLTGTDLYRDIRDDLSAQRSLDLARQLVVLQECAPDALPPAVRPRARVIFQSTTSRQPATKSPGFLRAVTVGHLRQEKSPQTVFEATRLLAGNGDIRIDQIGDALDPALGDAARDAMRTAPNFRWLGGRPHEETRRRIQRAHLLINCSRMEGGAHVIMEAVTSGTPVLASAIEGNVGMLGRGYAGYFPLGDAATLAALIRRCRDGQRAPDGGLLRVLQAQCQARAGLFAPEAERAAVLGLARELLVTI